MKVYVEGKLKKERGQTKMVNSDIMDVVADVLTILSKMESKDKPTHSYAADNANKITSKIEDLDNQTDDSLPF